MIDHIFNRYSYDLGYAYNQMLKELAELLLRQKIYPDVAITATGGIKLVPIKDASTEEKNLFSDVVMITGRCGGRCGAAMKRAKTRLVVQEAEKLKHLDMTGETLSTLARATIGRSVNRADRSRFATPGRTAENKSRVLKDHREEVELWINSTKHLSALFDVRAGVLRDSLASQWVDQWERLKNQVQSSKEPEEVIKQVSTLFLEELKL